MVSKQGTVLRIAIGLACLLLCVTAGATMSATREQILCNSSEIVIATILQGASADCRLQGSPDCSPQEVVRFSIRIDGVLGLRKGARGHRIGDVVEVTTRAVQILHPELSADLVPAGNLFVVPALDHVLTDSDVGSLFVGKMYIFALQPHGDPPFWSTVWDPRRQSWIEDILQNSDRYNCPQASSQTPPARSP